MAKEVIVGIRIAGLPQTGKLGFLLEQLRYAGVMTRSRNWLSKAGDEIEIIKVPRGIKEKEIAMWAKANAERMMSFGYTVEIIKGYV